MIQTWRDRIKTTSVATREAVVAFVVTYRRPALLRATLSGIAAQTRPPDSVIVMNNDPNDDIREGLGKDFPTAAVVDLTENVGSAGGFARALYIAGRQETAWSWLLDDDATPYPDALERLLGVAAALRAEGRPVGLLSPAQVASSGRFGWARWRHRPVPVEPVLRNGDEPFAIDLAYWAGLLVHRSVILEVGYPRTEFFRCYADYEYCLRARRAGMEIVAVPGSRVAHQEGLSRTVVRLGRRSLRRCYPPERHYYDARNAAFTAWQTLHSPLAVAFHVAHQCHLALGDLVYEGETFRRLALRIRGTLDGLRGQMGRKDSIG